jgi:hypothetical protein
MLVEDLMSTDVVTCEYDSSVRTAVVQLYWPTESLIDIRRDVGAAISINRSVDQYTRGEHRECHRRP